MEIPKPLLHLTQPAYPSLPRLRGVLSPDPTASAPTQTTHALWLDETRLLLAHKNSRQLDIWSTQPPGKELSLELPRGGLSLLEKLPDGRGLVAVFGRYVALLDVEWGSVIVGAEPYPSGDPTRELMLQGGSYWRAIVSPDSTTIYLLGDRHRGVSFYAWLVGEEGFSWSWLSGAYAIVDAALYKDTMTLFHEQRITQIDLYMRQPLGEVVPVLPARALISNGLMLSASEVILLLQVGGQSDDPFWYIARYDLAKNKMLWMFKESAKHFSPRSPTFFVRGQHLFYVADTSDPKAKTSAGKSIRVGALHLQTGEPLEDVLFFSGHSLHFAAISPGGEHLALITTKGQSLLFDWSPSR